MKNQELVLAFKTFVCKLVQWALSPPSKPGPFTIEVTGEEAMKNITTFTLNAFNATAATANPEGVAKRRFSVVNTAGSIYANDFDVAPDQNGQMRVTISIPQNVETIATLIDIDQAGNESSPQTHTWTPTDVTSPHQPSAFSIEVTGEEP